MPGDGIGKVVLPGVGPGARCGRIRGRVRPRRHRLGLLDQRRERAPRPDDRSAGQAQARALRRDHLQAEGGGRRASSRPELRGKGLVYFSPIVGMRQLFDLDICMRPCRSFPGNPLNFIRRTRTAVSRSRRWTPSSSGRTPRGCTRAWSGPIPPPAGARRPRDASQVEGASQGHAGRRPRGLDCRIITRGRHAGGSCRAAFELREASTATSR